MNANTFDDEYFGTLRWDTKFQEWHGSITVPPHTDVGLGLPPEYTHSDELRRHIREMVELIKREELSFRERAASELFAGGGYVLFWSDDEPFDHDKFVREMELARITFDPHSANEALTLWYEYGGGMEHGVVIFLTWDGHYDYARAS